MNWDLFHGNGARRPSRQDRLPAGTAWKFKIVWLPGRRPGISALYSGAPSHTGGGRPKLVTIRNYS